MIQRIQSVYLLVVAILMVIMMSLPIGKFIGADMSLTEFNNLSLVNGEGVANYEPWALFVILMLSAIITLATIFLYKKRILQMRLSMFNIILMLGYYGTLAAFVYSLKGDATFAASWTMCLPVVSIILDWLAIRAIGKDEMLVKAYDRLR